MNKITYLFPFFKNGKHIISPTRPEKAPIGDRQSQVFNNQAFEYLTLEVKELNSGTKVSVYGCVDYESEPQWVKLVGKSLNDGQESSEIGSNGLYSFFIAGIPHIRVELSADGVNETITGAFFGN